MNSRRHAVLDWFSTRLNVTEFLSLLGGFGVVCVELDSGKPPRLALADALSRPMPSYARWPRVLGLGVLVLVAIEIVTGALLALYYLPTPTAAHESVGLILSDVRFGWLIHQIHFWGAQALILTLMVRLVRYLAQGIYRSPRELEWLLGVALLGTALVGDTTGRLLLWSNDAYWTGVRLVEALSSFPLVGSAIAFMLGGEGTYLSRLTLIRAYGLHAAVVPTTFLLLIYLHFSSVRRLGLNETSGDVRLSGSALLRRHFAEIAIVLIVAMSALVTLAILKPQLFPCAADPYATLPKVQLPWYLLAPSGLMAIFGGRLWPSIVASLLLLAAVLLLPFVDHSRGTTRLLRPTVAAGLVALWIVLTLQALGGSP